MWEMWELDELTGRTFTTAHLFALLNNFSYHGTFEKQVVNSVVDFEAKQQKQKVT